MTDADISAMISTIARLKQALELAHDTHAGVSVDLTPALHARIASMQAEIYVLREANAYPAMVRRQARVEERERCARFMESGTKGLEDNVVARLFQNQAAAIRALGDD
jgi:hypothetical protein